MSEFKKRYVLGEGKPWRVGDPEKAVTVIKFPFRNDIFFNRNESMHLGRAALRDLVYRDDDDCPRYRFVLEVVDDD